MFREAIRSNEFEVVFDLVHKYDFSLKALLPHIIGSVMESIEADPYYMELKLHLIHKFFNDLPASDCLRMLEILEALFK